MVQLQNVNERESKNAAGLDRSKRFCTYQALLMWMQPSLSAVMANMKSVSLSAGNSAQSRLKGLAR